MYDTSVSQLKNNFNRPVNQKHKRTHIPAAVKAMDDDSVEISAEKKDKKGLSTKAKLMIGAVAITSVAAVVAYVLSRGKFTGKIKIPQKTNTPVINKPAIATINTKANQTSGVITNSTMPVKNPNLASVGAPQTFTPLKYKKADTIEDAILYAQQKFGIKYFGAPDLETANQINYSLTKLYNKTQGKYSGFKNVYYRNVMESSNAFVADDAICARTVTNYNGGVYHSSDLIINKAWFESASKDIEEALKTRAEFNLISQDANGFKALETITDYRYKHSINRYYRLYQQGKLTPKAQVDFSDMLNTLRNEELYLLSNKKSIIDFIKKERNVDLSGLSYVAYHQTARNILLDIKKKQNYVLSVRENGTIANGAAGLDGVILHEGGHAFHNQRTKTRSGIADYLRIEQADVPVAREVSPYATTNYNEFKQEYFAGILSGDKYSKGANDLYLKLDGIMP